MSGQLFFWIFLSTLSGQAMACESGASQQEELCKLMGGRYFLETGNWALDYTEEEGGLFNDPLIKGLVLGGKYLLDIPWSGDDLNDQSDRFSLRSDKRFRARKHRWLNPKAEWMVDDVCFSVSLRRNNRNECRNPNAFLSILFGRHVKGSLFGIQIRLKRN